MRIYLESLGCRLNYAEISALGRQLAGAGHEIADSADDADLCVVNSCAVTGEAARQSRQLARQLARANPAARLIVTGCYATLEGETVANLPNVSLVVGNAHKDELLALIQEAECRRQEPTSSARDSESALDGPTKIAIGRRPSAVSTSARTRAFIKVQDGCRNHCTFCIVTVVRGDERSRPIPEVVAEVNALHAEGYQEVVLTGVHLGGYDDDDHDLRLSGPSVSSAFRLSRSGLRALVEALLTDTTIPRLRLSSLEPFDLRPDFFDLWAASAGRLMPHLHLPAQSGSDGVLKRMARRNRAAEFEALAAAARLAIPGLTITTDLIAGFPGETEADFAETVEFARRLRFAHIHAFTFSARAGTAAARLGNHAPEAERKRRTRILNELDAELGAAVRHAFVGGTRPVLWEHRDPALHAQSGAGDATVGVWSGLTDNYLRVFAAVPTGVDLHNRITPVRLTRLEGDALWGEPIVPEAAS